MLHAAAQKTAVDLVGAVEHCVVKLLVDLFGLFHHAGRHSLVGEDVKIAVAGLYGGHQRAEHIQLGHGELMADHILRVGDILTRIGKHGFVVILFHDDAAKNLRDLNRGERVGNVRQVGFGKLNKGLARDRLAVADCQRDGGL